MRNTNPFVPKKTFCYCFLFVAISSCNLVSSQSSDVKAARATKSKEPTVKSAAAPNATTATRGVDADQYDKLMLHLANNDSSGRWPAKAARPLEGALLPYNRIVAFYGNLFSKRMGILGEIPESEMLERLKMETKKWQQADTLIKALPALHYIAVTAQPKPGANNKYRQRMPSEQIEKVIEMAKKIDAIVFLDIQVGHSTLKEELPALERFLSMPQVHLGIDPEFAMQGGIRPGARIGSFDAEDVNYASGYLSGLVRNNRIPPKMLVVHRFTQGMVTNVSRIKTMPEVQVVMTMDGFGFPAKKVNTYERYISKEPVQFTGFKLFYKNDQWDRKYGKMMTPDEVLKLKPRPSYLQYQ